MIFGSSEFNPWSLDALGIRAKQGHCVLRPQSGFLELLLGHPALRKNWKSPVLRERTPKYRRGKRASLVDVQFACDRNKYKLVFGCLENQI